MLIDLEDSKITIYYLKLKGKEYKLILEFPSSIINKKELYEKYDNRSIGNYKPLTTNCYIKKPFDKDRSDLFLITLPKFIYPSGIIMNTTSIRNYKPSDVIYLNNDNALKLILKGNKIGPIDSFVIFPYIDNEILKEKTEYDDILELFADPHFTGVNYIADGLHEAQELYSIRVKLKEKGSIYYRIEITEESKNEQN